MSDLPPPSSTDPTPVHGTPIAAPTPPAQVPVPLPPPTKVTQNPQVMAAIITGIISLGVAVVGIVPTLIAKDKDKRPSATPAAVVIIFTPTITQQIIPSPTSTQLLLPTASQPSIGAPNIVAVGPSMTPLPIVGASLVPADLLHTSASPAATAGTNEPNIRIYFDRASFTIRNQTDNQKTLAGVTFFSDEGRWEALQWGPIHEKLTGLDCLRLRDVSTSPRNPPADCQSPHLLALLEVGPAAIFWRDENGFQVHHNEIEVGVCTISPCDLYLPPN